MDIMDHATKLVTSVIAMTATKARYVKSNRVSLYDVHYEYLSSSTQFVPVYF